MLSRIAVLVAVSGLSFAAAAEAPRLGRAEPPAKAGGAVRLATYNVLNLFDAHDDPTLSGDQDDMRSVKSEREKEAVAETLQRLDADVVALQEVESLQALIEFRNDHLQGLGYDYVVSIDAGDDRGIEQSLLSRFPITEARVFPSMPLGGVHPDKYGDEPNFNAGEPIECRRSPLVAVVTVPGEDGAKPYEITLFVVHHKSGRYNDYWRDKESARFSELIRAMQAADPNRNIAVLGDFNATPTDISVRTYADAAGMTDVVQERSPGDDAQLTHESDRTIDMIWVNGALGRDLIPGSAFVLGTPLRPRGADWRTTPTPEGYASDHLPVAVDLTPVDR